jgi:uncharacterized protein
LKPPELVHKIAERLVRHPWQVLAIALLLSGLSIWAAIEIPFYTSRKALLPQDADVSKRLDKFLDRFGAASDLIICIEGAKRPEMEQFASQLVKQLRQGPLVRSAVERVDLLFFFKRAYLMVPPEKLAQFYSVLQKLINVPVPAELDTWDDAVRRLENWLDNPPPLSSVDVDLQTAEGSLHLILFFLDEWVRWLESPQVPESFNWQSLLARYGGGKLAAGKGYFTSHSGDMLFLFVRAATTSEEYSAVAPFVEYVRKTAEDLRSQHAKKGATQLKVAMTGLPAITYEEFKAIGRDIVFTVCTAAVLILLLIGLWLRSLKWALVVFVPMGLGVLWNIGMTYLIVGHLNMITSTFTAILFGLGVDYGIFMSTRIMEERRQEPDLKKAIAGGVASSGKALLTAGGATVLIFGALTTVPFTGFANMGMVAASGVLLVLLSTFLLQPVIFALLPPSVNRFQRKKEESPKTIKKPGMKLSLPVNVLLVGAALTFCGVGAVTGFNIPFDYDVLSLLPDDSEAALYQRRMVAESDFQGEVIIYSAESMAEARQMTDKASKLKTISQVQSITNLFPTDAGLRSETARKIAKITAESAYLQKIMDLGKVELTLETLERISSSVEKTETLIEDSQEMAFSSGHKHLVKKFEKILDRIATIQDKIEAEPELARKRTEDFGQTIMDAARLSFDVLISWKKADKLEPKQLPKLFQDRFFAKDGTIAIYAFPAKSVYDPDNLEEMLEEVYSISKNATGFPTTHQVFSHMAVSSFRQGTILSAIVAILWILLILRRLSGFIIALLPLLVGGGWMLGITVLAGTKFTYANIIALPLVMGLAVDYGVWFAHRRRERSDLNGWQVSRLAGRAILLAAGTTLAGLGAISLASYKGVASMGISVTIGLCCCVVTALLISPAISELFFRRRK